MEKNILGQLLQRDNEVLQQAKQKIMDLELTNDETDTMMRTWQKNSRKYQQKIQDIEEENEILQQRIEQLEQKIEVCKLADGVGLGTAPAGAGASSSSAGTGASSSSAGTAPAGAGATGTRSMQDLITRGDELFLFD